MSIAIQDIAPSALDTTDKALVRRGSGPLDHTMEVVALAPIAASGSASDLDSGTIPAARFDDTAHGNRAGGALHDLAIAAGDAGFMSGADKSKLDAIKAECGPTRWYAFDDMQGVTGDTEWAITSSGSGAVQAVIVSKPDTGPGWNTFALGTTTTGRTSRHTNLNGIDLAEGLATYGARFRVGALSDGTNTYTSRWGFLDSISAESVDGVFFRYTHSVNGGRFQAVTRSNSTETAADTGITAAINTTYVVRVVVDTTVPEAKFYIDGALVATITTNIPSGLARTVGVGTMGLKSAGTTATSYALMDYQFGEQIIAGRT